jgi:ABC-type glycerol-3-phosphate transport system substrate-binding protein
MTIKRVRFAGVALTMTIVLASCAANAAPTAAPAPPAAVTKAPEAPKPATETVKIYSYINGGQAGRGRPEGSDPARFAEVNAIFKKALNIEVVPIIPPGGAAATEKLNLLLSSPGEKLDVFQADWTQYADAALPLNDLLQKFGPNILKAWPKESWARVTDSKGNIMGIPRQAILAPYPVYFRTDLLKKLNLAMPKTVDEFEAFLKAHKASDPEAIPLITNLAGIRMGFAAAFTDNGQSNWKDAAGKLMPAETQPGYKDMVAKLADWYSKGYINKDVLGETDLNKLRNVLKTQKVGATMAWYSTVTLGLPAVQQVNADVQMAALTSMTGPKGKAQTIDAVNANTAVLLSKRAGNPEAIIKFIDWQYADLKNHLTADRGVEGKDWSFVTNAEVVKDLAPGTKLIKAATYAETGYIGEGVLSLGIPLEKQYILLDAQGMATQHSKFLNGTISDISVGKMPVDASISYDGRAVRKVFANLGDFDRLRDEELIKFINGSRPISDWDKYMTELKAAGLDLWSEAYTTLYNAQVK